MVSGLKLKGLYYLCIEYKGTDNRSCSTPFFLYAKCLFSQDRHVTCTVTKVIPMSFFLFPDSNFVLGNAQAPGCPIVYCSDGFIELTGFTRAQVMGRSCACKFLYGNSTVVMEKDKIDNALEHKEELKTELIFYRKDGMLYLISPAFCKKYDCEPLRQRKGICAQQRLRPALSFVRYCSLWEKQESLASK